MFAALLLHVYGLVWHDLHGHALLERRAEALLDLSWPQQAEQTNYLPLFSPSLTLITLL